VRRAYVFGLGSPFGEDRLGWLAAEQLGRDLAHHPQVVVDTLNQPNNLFVHPLDPEALLIFVDAMVSGRDPGSVRQFSAAQLETATQRVSSHGMDLKTTLDLLTAMGFPPAQIRVLGVEIAGAEVLVDAQALPAALSDAVQTVCAHVESLVEDWLSTKVAVVKT
jgi:hydrogenase maturation protease